MGNKSNRLKKIPNFITPPNLDELPVEIIYKILDQLDLSIVFTSLYHVCKRLDEILSTYYEYHLDLKNLTLKNFNFILSRIRPEQVVELILSDDDHSSGLTELFASKYSIYSFQRLRSLTLIQINDEELINQILIPIADRRSLSNISSIKIINKEENYDEIFVDVLMSILTKPSLREVYLDLSASRTTSNPLPWVEESPIQHLTLIGTCTVNFIRNILVCVPQLESLKINDLDFESEVDLIATPNIEDDDEETDEDELEEVPVNEDEDEHEDQPSKKEEYASINPPSQLKSLILDASTISMSKFEWLLPQIPTLKHLRLLTEVIYDKEILDGQRWERLVSTIDKFEFVFSVNISLEPQWNGNECIRKFRSLFWIEEKKWFVSVEKYEDDIILYTLPYRNNVFVVKNKSSTFEYHSTAEENSILQIQSMNNIQDLYIDVSTLEKSPFEVKKFIYFYCR